MTATHPEGRGRVKLEVEICAAGVPFRSGSCIIHQGAEWTDVTATPGGVVLTETPTGLAPDALYRWRARAKSVPRRPSSYAKSWAMAVESSIERVRSSSTTFWM